MIALTNSLVDAGGVFGILSTGAPLYEVTGKNLAAVRHNLLYNLSESRGANLAVVVF